MKLTRITAAAGATFVVLMSLAAVMEAITTPELITSTLTQMSSTEYSSDINETDSTGADGKVRPGYPPTTPIPRRRPPPTPPPSQAPPISLISTTRPQPLTTTEEPPGNFFEKIGDRFGDRSKGVLFLILFIFTILIILCCLAICIYCCWPKYHHDEVPSRVAAECPPQVVVAGTASEEGSSRTGELDSEKDPPPQPPSSPGSKEINLPSEPANDIANQQD